MFILHTYMCSMDVPGAHGGQKRASNPWNWSYNGCELPYGWWELNLGPLQERGNAIGHGDICPDPKLMLFLNSKN